MASGVAYVLHTAGYRVAIAEIEAPRAIRRAVAFAEAVYRGHCQVEHITGQRVSEGELDSCWTSGIVPVVVDPEAALRTRYSFPIIVDALMSKANAGGTTSGWASLVIGLGPGFTAPKDCHIVVETMRGHYLGRFYDRGRTFANTGEPGEVGGESTRRVVRAPRAGSVAAVVEIGQQVSAGEKIATVGGEPVSAAVSGVVRGVMAPGCKAKAGEKIADVDPRGRPEYCGLVSEKARLIGAGVRSAIEWWFSGRPYPLPASPEPL